MRSVLLRSDLEHEDALVTELWELGTIGIEEDGGTLRAYFDESTELDSFLGRYRHRVLEVRVEADRPETATPYGEWDPVLAGERFFLVPSWSRHETPSGRMRLSVDAQASFGTGRHESTQLMIEALERYVRPHHTVVDVGCGSGILSAAATMLGAAQVISCDVDADAIAEARRLLETPLFRGSAESIRDAAADLVLANLTQPILDRIRGDLQRIAKPGGRLIISGFLAERGPNGFFTRAVFERDGWQCWICEGPR